MDARGPLGSFRLEAAETLTPEQVFAFPCYYDPRVTSESRESSGFNCRLPVGRRLCRRSAAPWLSPSRCRAGDSETSEMDWDSASPSGIANLSCPPASPARCACPQPGRLRGSAARHRRAKRTGGSGAASGSGAARCDSHASHACAALGVPLACAHASTHAPARTSRNTRKHAADAAQRD